MIRKALILAALALPAPALAQAYQCRAPASITMPRAPQPDGPKRASRISGYTLAVSWSPEFCRGGKAGSDPDSLQCNGSIGRFGFVLHGLWPESGQGKYPQWCSVIPRPTEAELKANLCMTPAAYFKVSSILWNGITLPDADKLSRKDGLTAGDLRQAFVALNPGWRAESVGLRVSNGGWLREMQLCYGKDFRPARCEARMFGPKNDAPLKIWRGL